VSLTSVNRESMSISMSNRQNFSNNWNWKCGRS